MRATPPATVLLTALLLVAACSSPEPGADGSLLPAGDGTPAEAAAPDVTHVAADLATERGSELAADLSPDTAACQLLGVYSSSDLACNSCAEGRCCAELNGCFAEEQCDGTYVNCTLACVLMAAPDAGVDACLAGCAADSPLGKELYDLAMGCAELHCAAECD